MPLGDAFADVRATKRSPPPRSARSTARSRTTARRVAVKVQYPGVAEAVETDLRNLGVLLPLVKRLAPGLDVKALAAELRERIAEELDYEIEAQNHRAVERAWRGHPFAYVPPVDTALSSRRVLVTELLEGRRFEEVKQLGEAERDRFAEIVFRFFFGTLNHLAARAGDPHPGNYLLLDDGRVGFLDFGLMRVVDAGLPRARARDRPRGGRGATPTACRPTRPRSRAPRGARRRGRRSRTCRSRRDGERGGGGHRRRPVRAARGGRARGRARRT